MEIRDLDIEKFYQMLPLANKIISYYTKIAVCRDDERQGYHDMLASLIRLENDLYQQWKMDSIRAFFVVQHIERYYDIMHLDNDWSWIFKLDESNAGVNRIYHRLCSYFHYDEILMDMDLEELVCEYGCICDIMVVFLKQVDLFLKNKEYCSFWKQLSSLKLYMIGSLPFVESFCISNNFDMIGTYIPDTDFVSYRLGFFQKEMHLNMEDKYNIIFNEIMQEFISTQKNSFHLLLYEILLLSMTSILSSFDLRRVRESCIDAKEHCKTSKSKIAILNKALERAKK